MTCKRILITSKEKNSHFTTVLYAIVSKFNIDGLYPFIYTKWQVIIVTFHFNK